MTQPSARTCRMCSTEYVHVAGSGTGLKVCSPECKRLATNEYMREYQRANPQARSDEARERKNAGDRERRRIDDEYRRRERERVRANRADGYLDDWHERNPGKREEYQRTSRERKWMRDNASCRIPLDHPARADEYARIKRERYEADYAINRDRYIANARVRRSRAEANGPMDSGITRRAVFERDAWKCRACGIVTTMGVHRSHPKRAILGHINAVAAGGTHTWDNVCCLCHPCNVKDGVNRVPIQTSLIP